MKVLRVIIAMALMLMPTMPFASWMPNCSLSKDKSTLEVIASNPSDTRYHCQAWCRMKISGERAIQKFDCTFNLGSNASEKVMCNQDSGAPGYFSEVLPTKSTCVPR